MDLAQHFLHFADGKSFGVILRALGCVHEIASRAGVDLAVAACEARAIKQLNASSFKLAGIDGGLQP